MTDDPIGPLPVGIYSAIFVWGSVIFVGAGYDFLGPSGCAGSACPRSVGSWLWGIQTCSAYLGGVPEVVLSSRIPRVSLLGLALLLCQSSGYSRRFGVLAHCGRRKISRCP